MSWYFDKKTLVAIILWNKDDTNDINMILDPMDLLNFDKEDMQKLHESPIKVYGDWDEEAKAFTHENQRRSRIKGYPKSPGMYSRPVGQADMGIIKVPAHIGRLLVSHA
ncbi:hypothetical protein R6Q57_019699 [Mikania cordata]